ncbi:MAG: hypothetical protein L3J97_04535 [Thermoplasmata archaeon]|nr:hypothetical protein [Thermoplasmata archaeon]
MRRFLKITVVLLLVAASAGATAWWIYSQSTAAVGCGGSQQGPTPLGSAMAIGTPAEQTRGPYHWYNFSVASSDGGRELAALTFQFQTATGLNVSHGARWSLTVLNLSGGRIGAYALTGAAAGTWSSGGTQPLFSTELISLLTVPENVSGDLMIVSVAPASGSCFTSSGSIIVNIP